MELIELPEDRPSYGSNMPEAVAKIYDEIVQHLLTLRLRWRITEQITRDDDTISLLNSCAPNFFSMVQFTFDDAILLELSRLCDPHIQGNSENLTIDTLQKMIAQTGRTEISDRLDPLIKSMYTLVADVKTVRNKRIAHSDLPTSFDRSLLPRVTRVKVGQAMALLVEIMKTVETDFNVVPIDYDDFMAHGDGSTLVELLKKVKT